MGLLQNLRPDWWFAGHMHTRFEATVVHPPLPGQAPSISVQKNPDEIQIEDEDEVEGILDTSAQASRKTGPITSNPDEIVLDDEEDNVDAPPPLPLTQPSETRFLALDKCGQKRQFLEVVDVPASQVHDPPLLAYDPEWLAITRAFHPWLSTTRQQPSFPDESTARGLVAKELEWVKKNVKSDESGEIPVKDYQTFGMTAPGPGNEGKNKFQQRESLIFLISQHADSNIRTDDIPFSAPWYTNPQTEAFCHMLDIPNKINPPPANLNANGRSRMLSPQPPDQSSSG